MPKLKWSKEEKKLVVLELLKGGKSVGQISKERGISEALIYRWRDQACYFLIVNVTACNF